MKLTDNATFHSFKVTGKWYATDRGHLPRSAYLACDRRKCRAEILKANDGKYPGLGSDGVDKIFVVIPDETLDYGYPLMLLSDYFMDIEAHVRSSLH